MPQVPLECINPPNSARRSVDLELPSGCAQINLLIGFSGSPVLMLFLSLDADLSLAPEYRFDFIRSNTSHDEDWSAPQWRHLCETVPRSDSSSNSLFWSRLDEHLHNSQPDDTASIINLFRAFVAMNMNASNSIDGILSYYRLLTPILFERSQFAQWRYLTLSSPSSNDLSQVQCHARALLSRVDSPKEQLDS